MHDDKDMLLFSLTFKFWYLGCIRLRNQIIKLNIIVKWWKVIKKWLNPKSIEREKQKEVDPQYPMVKKGDQNISKMQLNSPKLGNTFRGGRSQYS